MGVDPSKADFKNARFLSNNFFPINITIPSIKKFLINLVKWLTRERQLKGTSTLKPEGPTHSKDSNQCKQSLPMIKKLRHCSHSYIVIIILQWWQINWLIILVFVRKLLKIYANFQSKPNRNLRNSQRTFHSSRKIRNNLIKLIKKQKRTNFHTLHNGGF